MAETFYIWAKDNGDVLGTIGFLFAMLTMALTNGKIVLQRMRGNSAAIDAPFAPGAITLPDTAGREEGSVALAGAPLPPPNYGDKMPIAILPPKEHGEHGEYDDHFAAGLADDLVADLQRASFATPDIATVARMVKSGADASIIARDLGVKHVLATSIRRQDDKIRVSAQLIDPTGTVHWSDRYNLAGDDLMAIQENVAEKVASAVADQLKPTLNLRNPDTGQPYGSRAEALTAVSSPKSRFVALLLCLPPLGILGAHRFYVGRPFTGLLYIPTAGLVVFGWLIDMILILFGMFADGKGRPLRIWRHDPLRKLSTTDVN